MTGGGLLKDGIVGAGGGLAWGLLADPRLEPLGGRGRGTRPWGGPVLSWDLVACITAGTVTCNYDEDQAEGKFTK